MSTSTDLVAAKLKKAQGQVNGIVTMYDGGRPCLEIVQQIAAARSALSSVAKDILADEASRCARCQSPQDFDRILKSFIELT